MIIPNFFLSVRPVWRVVPVGTVMFLAVLLAAAKVHPEEFAGEAYLLGYSVSLNSSAGSLPSQIHSPSQALGFPAVMDEVPALAVELASLPAFNGMADIFSLYGNVPLDSNTEIGTGTAIIPVDGITVLPGLSGTKNQRMSDPSFRPELCSGQCRELKNVTYIAYLNLKKRFRTGFPRSDFSSRPLPLDITLGSNIKYLKDELEGADYIAQNINMDLSMNLRLVWDTHPGLKIPSRVFSLNLSGFELLQTSQVSQYAAERIPSRYHAGIFWTELLPRFSSHISLGVEQASEWGNYPGFGVEWKFRESLYIRGGANSEFIACGASLKYRFVSFHYSLQYHQLAATPYQLSLQIQRPCCFF